MPQKFYYDKISLHAPVTLSKAWKYIIHHTCLHQF